MGVNARCPPHVELSRGRMVQLGCSQWPIQSVLFARSMLHLGMSRVFGKGYVSRAGAQHPCLQIHRCTNLAILIFQGVWMLQLGNFPMACPSFMLFISRCLDVATGKLPNGMSKLSCLVSQGVWMLQLGAFPMACPRLLPLTFSSKQCCAHPAPIRQDGRQTPQTRNKCVQRFGAC